ncbi:MAG: hypothetical protein ACK5V3_16765 [Bdellovibrionales bacterium]
MPALKINKSILASLGLALCFLIVGVSIYETSIFSDSVEITFASEESKTTKGETVFNKIRLIQDPGRDIWMMNQSHLGLNTHTKKWDRLAIVIDKTKPIKTALFIQLPPGELNWEDRLIHQGQNFKVSCYFCHSNGPRAVRPDFSISNLSWNDKITLGIWNFKIKLYGRIMPHPLHEKSDPELITPFKHSNSFDDSKLKIKSCTLCHNDSGLWARGYLVRQNSITIRFMVNNHLMPPPGFKLTKEDQKEIDLFLRGF